jgi:nucleoside-diphosphate kinase
MLKSLLFSLLCPFFCLSASDTMNVAAIKAPSEISSNVADQKPKEAPIEQTFSIIKPDAVENNVMGEILEYFETAGLRVVASKMIRLTPEQAKTFYAEHKDKPFFQDLVTYMTSGPVVVQVLEGEDAIALNRQVMGATDPAKASPGTIRSDFGTDISHNAVHGSDSTKSAKKEISQFFKPDEIFSKQ